MRVDVEEPGAEAPGIPVGLEGALYRLDVLVRSE